MRIIVTEKSIELVPESDFERESLKRLMGKWSSVELKAQWQDSWELSGNLILKQLHDPDNWGS